MKRTKTYFLLLLAVFLLPAMSQSCLTTEPDTIWTNKYAVNGKPTFTTDGSRIIVNGADCINASNGETIWSNDSAFAGYFEITHDEQYIVSCDRSRYLIQYYSLDSGIKTKTLDTIYKKNWQSFFSPYDTSLAGYKVGWQLPEIGTFIYGDDDSVAFITYEQIFEKETEPVVNDSAKVMLCRYDLVNDTILTAKIITLAGDSVLTYNPILFGGLNIPNTDYFTLIHLDKYDGFSIKLYDKSTLDSVSIFTIDLNKYGDPWNIQLVPSHSGEKLAICNKKGYLLMLNVPELSVYKDTRLSSDTLYSFDSIDFSQDDSLIVTLEDWKRFNGIKIRKLADTTTIYTYSKDLYGAFITVSPDNSKIATSYILNTTLLHARWNPTIIEEEKENPITSIVYPNPAGDYIEISGVVGEVKVFDVLGIEHPATVWHPSTEGNVRIDVSALPQGVYFVSVGDKVIKFVKI